MVFQKNKCLPIPHRSYPDRGDKAKKYVFSTKRANKIDDITSTWNT